tara:strand:+ start:67 stop:432 length:366 start_codon:yes stop_codon:yes gene_type:complete
MGYRSVVKIIFYTLEDKDFPALKLWVDENIPDEFDFTESSRDGYRVLCYDNDWVKWYDSFPEVAAMQKALDRFDQVFGEGKTPLEFAYEFIRMGEEDEDIERRSSDDLQNLITVRRSIEWS